MAFPKDPHRRLARTGALPHDPSASGVRGRPPGGPLRRPATGARRRRRGKHSRPAGKDARPSRVRGVDLAPNGQVALEQMRLVRYELLIADLQVPGMDGLTVIHEARRLNADLPVIIITGFSTEASAIGAANLGVS
ncbi:MAG: response regulator [bacterium]